MRKSLVLFMLMLLGTAGAHAQGAEQMEFRNDFREASGGLGNITSMFMSDGWWSDANGDDAAVIRIKVIDMSISEMQKLSVKGSPNLGMGKRQFFEKEQQWLVAVSAGGNNMYLEMTHPTYGISSRLRIDQKLKPRAIYDVTLVNNKTTSISVRSIPDGADVYLDGDKKGKTPCEIPGQRFGSHELKVLYGGGSLVRQIQVEEGHTVFDGFDFRERRKVSITSDPDGATIYVDGELIGKAPILEHEMILGAHTFKAVLNAEQMDETSVNITRQSTTVALHPVKKSNVQILTKYSGRPVSATLVVDNQNNYTGQEVYHQVLPYGSHTFRVTYSNKTKEKTIRVNKPEMSHTFKLSAKNDIVWPWKREFDQRPVGLSAGYVSKRAVSKNGSDRYKFDPAYVRENKRMSGMQLGIHVQPTFSWGGGLYSGLFYELYMTKCDEYGEAVKKFTEHVLNIPIHLYYRIAFTQKVSLSIHSGIGMDIGIRGCYANGYFGISEDNGDGTSTTVVDDYYGADNGGPKRFNLTWDIAGSININKFAINAFLSRGLLNHDGMVTWDDGGGKTVIDKFGLSVSFLFGNE